MEIDYSDGSSNIGSNFLPGLFANFYVGSTPSGSYDQFYQLTDFGLTQFADNSGSSPTTISSSLNHDPDNMYDFVDFDGDGDLDLFDYDPIANEMSVYERTSTTGTDQLTLVTGADDPLDGIDMEALANGGTGSATVETYRWLNADSDAELELVVSSLTNTHVYDFT